MKCEECKVFLTKTTYKYEGKPLYTCPECEEEYI